MSEPGNLRLRFTPDDKREFDEVWGRLGLSQQEGFTRMMRWFAEQDPVVQTMILGQVPASPDLVQLVLHRLAAAESARKHGAAKGHGYKPLKAAMNRKQLGEEK